MQPLKPGNLHNRLFKWMLQPWVDNRSINYSTMKNMELHERYRLDKILIGRYTVTHTDKKLVIQLPCCSYAVKAQNGLVTEFIINAVLIEGVEDNIRSSQQQSPLYSIAKGIDSDCEFVFEQPNSLPWLLLLKLSCFEGNEFGKHPKHYGMRVLACS